MTLLADNARLILAAALESENGIQVHVERLEADLTAPALRAKAVLLRFKAENADFGSLQISPCPTDPDNRLWLLKQRTETD